MTKLSSLLTADGSSTPQFLEAGYYIWSVGGTFGSGTVQLEMNPSESGWVPITDASLTAPGTKYIGVAAGKYRVTVSGATDPSLFSDMNRITDRMEILTGKGG